MLSLVHGFLRGKVLKQRHVLSCVYSVAICSADSRRGRPSNSPPVSLYSQDPAGFAL